MTDHRIGLTLYKIEAVLNGDLDELIDALRTADQAEKLRPAKKTEDKAHKYAGEQIGNRTFRH